MQHSFGILMILLLAAAPARAQFGPCASIADPAARLMCYDRQAGATGGQAQPQRYVAPQAAMPPAGGGCTPASPCIGPRGGRYYYTA